MGPSLSLRWSLLAGASLGCLFHVGLFVLSLLQYGSSEYMGVRNEEIQGRIVSMFLDTVILQELAVLLIHAVLGLAIGLACGLWVFLVVRAFRPVTSRRLSALAILLSLGAAHTLFLWYGMSVYPRLFIDQFYNGSVLPSLFQYIGSELLTPWILKAAGSLWLLSFPLLAHLAARRKNPSPPRSTPAQGPASKPPSLPLSVSTVVLSLVVLVLVAWQWTPVPDAVRFRPAGATSRPNVLILALDSLRPDYMEGAAGDGLARMRRESLSYTQAVSPFPRTFPAWVSMLTGQEPTEHGIRHMFPQPELLSRHRTTLAGTLAEAGWETAVFSDFAGDIFGRIDLGFDHVEVPEFSLRSNVRLGVWKMHIHLIPYLVATGLIDRHEAFWCHERLADPRALTDRFFTWLDEREGDRPFMALLFYSATHFPYGAAWPHYRNHRQPGYSGPHRFCKLGLGLASDSISEQDIAQIRSDFRASVDAADVEVERVLDLLSDSGLLDNTLIVLTADHGENLYEGNLGNGHGDMLNGRYSLRTPFLIRRPAEPTSLELSSPVSMTALAPTVLGLLGLPVPPEMTGENLAANPGFAPTRDRPVFSESGLIFIDPDTEFLSGRSIRFGDLMSTFLFTPETFELYFNPQYESDARTAKHRMVMAEGHKLLYIPSRQKVTWECYDLRSDPEETRNIDSPDHPVCNRLRELLYQHMLSGGDGRRIGDYVVP